MDLPLISHPTRDETPQTYPAEHLTDNGDLRLTTHNRVVAERATRLYSGTNDSTSYLKTAAALHDFGKVTPQFQAHVRPEESYDGPDAEKAHARLGALVTWYVLGGQGAPDRDRLAATLAVARHHQALPNTASYTAEILATAFENGATVVTNQLDKITETWPQATIELIEQTGVDTIEWPQLVEWAKSGAPADELRELCTSPMLGGFQLEQDQLPPKLYDRMVHYWAAITLADKSHAMDIPPEHVFDTETLEKSVIDEYVAGLRAEPPENELTARLNDERERARRQAVQGVHEWLDTGDTHIATLTLPTGLGKTFTGLSAAFEARDIQAPSAAEERPVIYALPYTSIIEQTRVIFEDPELWGADPQRSALTVHHYLSETVVHTEDTDSADSAATDGDKVASFLGEAWRDGTILTTFVQLFESLAGPSNRQGLKLSALESSLVILDEPQALPKDWWGGIQRLIETLTAEYDARVIAMTATQPTLVRNLKTTSLLAAGQAHSHTSCDCCTNTDWDTTELPPAPQQSYFSEAARVRYHIDETAVSLRPGVDTQYIGHESAAQRVLDTTSESGSTLAICNTISSSRTLTEKLNERPTVVHLGSTIEAICEELDVDATNPPSASDVVVDRALAAHGLDTAREDTVEQTPQDQHTETHELGSTTALLTLNSRLRPFDREIIIELADRLSTAEAPFILVSTQAIEAGVDLSFQTVFRDIAPLDSIVQAAGRCNRSYEWGEGGGDVTVWTLADPEEATPTEPTKNPPAYYVYEQGSTDAGIPGHLELISETLAQVPNRSDASDVSVAVDAVDSYFASLEQKSLSNTDLQDAIESANAQWLGRQSLIGGHETRDVLVAQTSAERTAVEDLSELLTHNVPDGYDKLQAAAAIRVSLPVSAIDASPQLNRLDRKNRGDDGVEVFEYTGGRELRYDLEAGGLQCVEDSVDSRFSI